MTDPFTPYYCPLGEVIAHEADSYIIATADGRVIGIQSATTSSPENVEADIAAAQSGPSEADQLVALKTALRNLAKDRRADLIASGFSYLGKQIQTRNAEDIANIANAALRASNDAAFTTAWIATDNTLLPLDSAGVVAMHATMVDRGNSIFAAYLGVMSQVEIAADLPAAEAIHDLAQTYAP